MFDSGFGGLTVARAVIDLLPREDLIYLGDTGRYPYGPRPLDEVARFAHQIAEELVDRRGVKLLVVGCNTASAAAMMAWIFIDWVRGMKPSAMGACIGAVVGRVAITPARLDLTCSARPTSGSKFKLS